MNDTIMWREINEQSEIARNILKPGSYPGFFAFPASCL